MGPCKFEPSQTTSSTIWNIKTLNDPPLPPPIAYVVQDSAPQVTIGNAATQDTSSDDHFFDLESLESHDKHQIIVFVNLLEPVRLVMWSLALEKVKFND